jgi:hypothetical protein
MRKFKMFWPAVAIALIAGAVFFWSNFWSKPPLLGSQTARASLGVFDAVETREAGVRISPFELMTSGGNDLPAESWNDPI